MQSIPYLFSTDAILRSMARGAYLQYDGIGWLLFNAAGEPTGATSTSVVDGLRNTGRITRQTRPAQPGVRWIATPKVEVTA